VANRATAIDQEDAVGDRFQQRRVLLLTEPQSVDRSCATQNVADAVDEQRPVDRLDDEVGGAGVVA